MKDETEDMNVAGSLGKAVASFFTRRPRSLRDAVEEHSDNGKTALFNAVIAEQKRNRPAAEECDGRASVKAHNFSLGIFPIVCWVVGALVFFWLFSVSSPFIVNALASTGARMYVSIGLAALPFLCVSGVLLWVLMRFRRVPKVRQLDLADGCIDKLEMRRILQDDYMRHFPSPERYADENGFTGEDRTNLIARMQRMKSDITAAQWLEEFRGFSELQDECASEVVKRYCKLVGIQTAVSPWKIVDMLIVVYNSAAMITALAGIYNRRTSPQGALRLAIRWIVNVYAAREMGEWTSSSASSLEGGAGSMLEGSPQWIQSLIQPVAKLLGIVVGKVAEGGANAFLIYRLGSRAKTFFRPVKKA